MFVIVGNFLLAAAFLYEGQYHKAYNLFIKAADGIHSEEYLLKKIMHNVTRNSKPIIWYYLKVSFCLELIYT